MTEPTAKHPGEFTQTRTSAATVDETRDASGTLDSAPSVTIPSDSLTDIEVGQRLDDFDLLVELGSGVTCRDCR